MRRTLFTLYWKARDVIAPSLKHSQAIYEIELRNYVHRETNWLDLGCGHQVLPFWREEAERDLIANCASTVGMDCDLPSLQKHRSISLRVQGKTDALPFADDSFDLVTANMVVEHLATPELQFGEINRVLKPGGVLLFNTPNAVGYPSAINRLVPASLRHKLIYLLDGRTGEDVFRTHYRANTKKRICGLARNTGFEVMKIQMTASDAIFALVLPIAIPELIYIRLLMSKRFELWRTDIITCLKKGEAALA